MINAVHLCFTFCCFEWSDEVLEQLVSRLLLLPILQQICLIPGSLRVK